MTREAPLPRSAFAAWRRIGTRWADNDAYGHVNNTVYYEWFDTAVNQWLAERALLDVAHGRIIGLVAATSCEYFGSLSFPGDIDVGLSAERIGTSSVTYRLGVFGAGQERASAQGRFTHVYVDCETRRPVSIPGVWLEALTDLTI